MALLMNIMEFTAGGLFCFITGWLMDLKGRKLLIIFGLVAKSLAYAMLSILPPDLVLQSVFVVVDSVAFGIFTVAFVFTVWADIANGQRSEKLYALGAACVPGAVALTIAFSPWLESIRITSLFPLAALFLFLAIIPLFLAPELLPEKTLKEREIKRYVEEAKKAAQR